MRTALLIGTIVAAMRQVGCNVIDGDKINSATDPKQWILSIAQTSSTQGFEMPEEVMPEGEDFVIREHEGIRHVDTPKTGTARFLESCPDDMRMFTYQISNDSNNTLTFLGAYGDSVYGYNRKDTIEKEETQELLVCAENSQGYFSFALVYQWGSSRTEKLVFYLGIAAFSASRVHGIGLVTSNSMSTEYYHNAVPKEGSKKVFLTYTESDGFRLISSHISGSSSTDAYYAILPPYVEEISYPENPISDENEITMSYFNYNKGDGSKYGPKNWDNVQYTKYNSEWWEFGPVGYGTFENTLNYPLRNECDGREQSPLNVYDSGAPCEEDHQIRTRKGDWAINDTEIMKQILPNKLRLEYQRRPCQTCAEPDPPHADFPHNWGGGSDVIHIDIKVPSEHYLEGKKFDGEFQIFHLHPRRRRSPAIAIPFEVGEHNQHLQKALDEFQKVYDGDLQKCNERNQRERVLKSNLHSNSSMTFPISDSIQSGSQYANEKRGRFLPIQEGESVGTRGAWDPYHEDIVKTIHFWVYEGSTTDPPCGEFVTWFVLDTPFTVSARQLKQIKDLIFTHQDKRCQKTSVHFEESVARPLQSLVGRTISRCTIKDFRSDEVMRLEK